MVSERLGYATAGFTLQVYSHVLPGMDQEAADTAAGLILGARAGNEAAVDALGGVGTEATTDRKRNAPGPEPGPDLAQTPLEKELAWAKAQASHGSGGTSQTCDCSFGSPGFLARLQRRIGRCHPLRNLEAAPSPPSVTATGRSPGQARGAAQRAPRPHTYRVRSRA